MSGPAMSGPAVEFFQFPYSHYNEKVRWTLAHKGIPHTRRSLLPGPHALTVLRLTGQTQTPVVRVDGRVVAGSAQIIDALERRFPERALYPADPVLRERALEWQSWADAHVGVMVRRALFAVMLDHPDYVMALFASDRPALTRALYRALFPVTRMAMASSAGVRGAASVDEAVAATQAALDRVAGAVGPAGHLVGEAMSVADVAVAALLTPAVRVEHPSMRPPPPVPDAVEAWYRRWDAHPAAAWVRETYRRHRPADA
jgi:glutathione S-transferase